jgi:hypothetical protein
MHQVHTIPDNRRLILVEGCHGKPLLEAPNPIGAGLVLTVDPSDPSFGGNIAFELLKREKGAAS